MLFIWIDSSCTGMVCKAMSSLYCYVKHIPLEDIECSQCGHLKEIVLYYLSILILLII